MPTLHDSMRALQLNSRIARGESTHPACVDLLLLSCPQLKSRLVSLEVLVEKNRDCPIFTCLHPPHFSLSHTHLYCR